MNICLNSERDETKMTCFRLITECLGCIISFILVKMCVEPAKHCGWWSENDLPFSNLKSVTVFNDLTLNNFTLSWDKCNETNECTYRPLHHRVSVACNCRCNTVNKLHHKSSPQGLAELSEPLQMYLTIQILSQKLFWQTRHGEAWILLGESLSKWWYCRTQKDRISRQETRPNCSWLLELVVWNVLQQRIYTTTLLPAEATQNLTFWVN